MNAADLAGAGDWEGKTCLLRSPVSIRIHAYIGISGLLCLNLTLIYECDILGSNMSFLWEADAGSAPVI